MPCKTSKLSLLLASALLIGIADFWETAQAQEAELPTYLKDRGVGLPTSMFGTYIRSGEMLIYPFFEFYQNHDLEYKPSEFGYPVDLDYQGNFRAYEGILFLGYGLTDWLALELEAAVISARLEKSSSDPTAMPDRIEESGVGDVEGQLRLRWTKETERQPEVFSYFEAVAPVQKSKALIGTSDWELKFGSGVIRGFAWGTVTWRLAGEYSVAESKLDLGEYAVEYLKRLSSSWRAYVGIEGTQDEVDLILEAQWHLNDNLFIKLNNAVGLTPKTNDWAPEIGVMFSLPLRH